MTKNDDIQLENVEDFEEKLGQAEEEEEKKRRRRLLILLVLLLLSLLCVCGFFFKYLIAPEPLPMRTTPWPTGGKEPGRKHRGPSFPTVPNSNVNHHWRWLLWSDETRNWQSRASFCASSCSPPTQPPNQAAVPPAPWFCPVPLGLASHGC